MHSVASAAGPRTAEVFADAVVSEFLLPKLRTHKKYLSNKYLSNKILLIPSLISIQYYSSSIRRSLILNFSISFSLCSMFSSSLIYIIFLLLFAPIRFVQLPPKTQNTTAFPLIQILPFVFLHSPKIVVYIAASRQILHRNVHGPTAFEI